MEPVLIEQFFLGCLAHASYVVSSEGIAAVIDPQRDVDLYLDYAREKNLRIAHIIETHLHADFVSGHHELAERTGARIYLGADAHATFPHIAIQDGDTLQFGNQDLDVPFGGNAPVIVSPALTGAPVFLRMSQNPVGHEGEPYRLYSVVQPPASSAASSASSNDASCVSLLKCAAAIWSIDVPARMSEP